MFKPTQILGRDPWDSQPHNPLKRRALPAAVTAQGDACDPCAFSCFTFDCPLSASNKQRQAMVFSSKPSSFSSPQLTPRCGSAPICGPVAATAATRRNSAHKRRGRGRYPVPPSMSPHSALRRDTVPTQLFTYSTTAALNPSSSAQAIFRARTQSPMAMYCTP